MNEERIKAKVTAREQAQELLGLIQVPRSMYRADWAEAFLDELRKHLPQRAANQEVEQKAPPISRLGARQIPFGKHNGMTFDETPVDYLEWLCSSQESFLKDLQAYLKHPELESRRPHG